MTRRPADPAQAPVYGLHHAAYRCRDAEETRAFYEDVLGFPLRQALEIDGHPTTDEPVKYMHIFFDIGSHDPAAPNYIAFFDVVDSESEHEAFDFKHQWGMDLHFAMAVKDHAALQAWRDRLVARGVEVEGPIDHGVCESIYFHDPNGYRLEFATEDARQQANFDEGSRNARANIESWNARKAAGFRAAAE